MATRELSRTQGHEEAAREAAARAQQENPTSSNRVETAQSMAVCSTPSLDGDAQQARAAEQERRLAEAHRLAAAKLRAGADADCAGVAESDRNTSPFSRRSDINGTRPLVPAGVRSATDRFAVDARGDSPSIVTEIEARTQRLVGNRWSD